jgi:hypothetical protein
VREVTLTMAPANTTLESVLAETGWAYHTTTHGRYSLHYAIRIENGKPVEHKAATEAELLRRVFDYIDKQDPVFRREILAGKRG